MPSNTRPPPLRAATCRASTILGIGTLNPSAKLHLNLAAVGTLLRVDGAGVGSVEAEIRNNANTDIGFAELLLTQRASVEGFRSTIFQQQWDRFVIKVRDHTVPDVDVISIRNSNVGIGTTTPVGRLDVSDSLSEQIYLRNSAFPERFVFGGIHTSGVARIGGFDNSWAATTRASARSTPTAWPWRRFRDCTAS